MAVDVEVITDANGNPFPGMTLSQATNNINWGNPGDQIYDGGPATTNSIHVISNDYFAPVGGVVQQTIIRHAPSKTRKQFKLLKPMLFLSWDNNHTVTWRYYATCNY